MVLTTIRLSRPGLSPPVYLAGTFTQWEPTIEMDHDAVFGSRDQHEFSKAVDIEAGEHQFKFRLGHGDWWIVDDSTPTVPDGFGNVNNVIHVFEQKELETKVVEVNEQSLPVKEVKPAPEVESTKDTLAPEVSVEEEKPTAQVPVIEEHKPAPAVPSIEETSVPEVPVKKDLPAPEVPVKEVKPTPEILVEENKSVQPELPVSDDKPVQEAPSTKDILTPVKPVEKIKPVPKAAVEEQKPIQPEIPVKEDKPAPEVPVKEVKPVQEAPSTKKTSTPEAPAKEAKPAPKTPFEEQKLAQPEVPMEEDKTPRKDTFAASIKTTTSELTAVVNQETSSIQSILRPSVDDNQAPSRQEPQTPNQKSQAQTDGTNGVPNYGAISTEEQKSVKKGSTESFIKRLFSCFSGKTAFGMAAVSAVLVAVIIRR